MKRNFPHPLIIMLLFILIAGISTYFIDSGVFEREIDESTGREIVIAGSFHEVEDQNASIYDILLAVPEGIILGADILVLILLIGGSFYVIEKTGALHIGIEALIYTFRKRQFLLLFFLGLVFALCGATFGMQEEVIALAPVLLILAKKLHYDIRSILALSLGTALVGGACSPINPFGSLLSLKIANLELGDGLWFKSLVFIFIVFSWILYHIWNGKIKNVDQPTLEFKPVFISTRKKIILFIMTLGILSMGWGITQKDWGFNEMSALFFLIGFSCGIIGNLGINGTAKAFTEGFGELIFAGVIVGLARSIYIILENSAIIDPLIQGLFSPLEGLPTQLAAIGMYFAQGVIHIPVPSTSGQAVLTTPLTAPLSDLLGISRHIAVMSYQYPAGFMDLLTPTNGGMMAVIAAAGVNYKEWFSYILKSWLFLMVLGLISVILGIVYFA
ncbi:YfcC family protein [Algoriphagus lutimaris]|uniref:YfcC family protein n=1 Tax=Algoriphagus lutimaris TaxID=613197 RepID=UPI00196B7324|nr:YfcC family protein [Algoriphagus lutimaris]MBN3518854.1 YfcC family protein [Algoriphagus lutimaris]